MPSVFAAYERSKPRVAADAHLFTNVRSYYFRRACSDHNREHGRYLGWADARAMWHAANAAAHSYVYGR